ncbi:MAG: hypothetical protein ACSHWZ_11980 [Sulfitobacter sp.]
MSQQTPVQIFLEPGLRKSAETGQHNFIKKLVNTLENSRFRVEFLDSDRAATSPYTLTHMQPAQGANGLIFRRVYHYPFWQIEQHPQRWRWDVAQMPFDPSQVPAGEAKKFANFWRSRLFGDLNTSRKGMIYVPLQGRLLERRSFQKCTPLEMLEAALTHANGRNVIAGLHPKESYSEAELSALQHLEKTHPSLTITLGQMEQHLAACDYVVTQNSAVAFSGYFLQKPALLFAQIDFHHIAIQADLADLTSSFAKLDTHAPAFQQYLWWFWQENSINAGRPDAETKIAARLARFGWPIEQSAQK